jgi:hypothetical protein
MRSGVLRAFACQQGGRMQFRSHTVARLWRLEDPLGT